MMICKNKIFKACAWEVGIGWDPKAIPAMIFAVSAFENWLDVNQWTHVAFDIYVSFLERKISIRNPYSVLFKQYIQRLLPCLPLTKHVLIILQLG